MHKFQKLLEKQGFKDVSLEQVHDDESTFRFHREPNRRFLISFDNEDKVIFFQGTVENSVYDLHELLYDYDDELTLHDINLGQLFKW